MPRFRVAVLVRLLLAGTSWAQTPGEDFELPKPTPVEPVRVAEAPSATDIPALIMPPVPARAAGWRVWVSADFAVAWVKGKPLPPLVTTSPPGTAQAEAGVLGLATPRTVLGNTH